VFPSQALPRRGITSVRVRFRVRVRVRVRSLATERQYIDVNIGLSSFKSI